MYDDDEDEEFFQGDDLTFEETMLKMSQLAKLFRSSGKVDFFVDNQYIDEDGYGVPSFRFHQDTTFGFVFPKQ